MTSPVDFEREADPMNVKGVAEGGPKGVAEGGPKGTAECGPEDGPEDGDFIAKRAKSAEAIARPALRHWTQCRDPSIYTDCRVINSIKQAFQLRNKCRFESKINKYDSRIIPVTIPQVNSENTAQYVKALESGFIRELYCNGVFPFWFIHCNGDHARPSQSIREQMRVFRYKRSIIYSKHILHMLVQVYNSLKEAHADFNDALKWEFYNFAHVYACEHASMAQMIVYGRQEMPHLFTDEWALKTVIVPCTAKQCVESCFDFSEDTKGTKVICRDHTGFNYTGTTISLTSILKLYKNYMREILKMEYDEEFTEQRKIEFIHMAIYYHKDAIARAINTQCKKLTYANSLTLPPARTSFTGANLIESSNVIAEAAKLRENIPETTRCTIEFDYTDAANLMPAVLWGVCLKRGPFQFYGK